MRGVQSLLRFGIAAGLKDSRIDDHLTEAALVHDSTANLLPADDFFFGGGRKKEIHSVVQDFVNRGGIWSVVVYIADLRNEAIPVPPQTEYLPTESTDNR